MFKSVVFYTNKLRLVKRFYVNVLGLEITKSTNEQFTVNVGDSDITFQQSEDPSFYHFAINIPGNQFFIMKEWIKDRLTLIRRDRKSTRLNSSHVAISYAVFCLIKKKKYLT